MQTKEQLLYYFISKDKRIQYHDRRFFTNIATAINKNQCITSGQAHLFDKLVVKYEPHLKGMSLTQEQLIALPWKITIVETSKEYTSAKLMLNDGNLVLKVPTNNSFIRKFDNYSNNTFKWNSKTKTYISPFSTMALKIAYTLLPKYFSNTYYCSELNAIISKLEEYATNEIIWNPTLVKCNSNYFVAASNQVIDDCLKDTSLDADPKILYLLSKLGVTIHDSLKQTPLAKFASDPFAEIDITNLNDLADWLPYLEVDAVVVGRGVSILPNRMSPAINDMIRRLKEVNIECLKISTHASASVDVPTKSIVLLQTYSSKINREITTYTRAFGKCIIMKNSLPVNIK